MKDLNFVAVDFETANSNYSSICQIGFAFFENGELIKQECQLINPHTYFDGMNTRIHGITSEHVEGFPSFSEYYPEFVKRIDNQVVVHHQPFDYSAYCQACELHDLEHSNTYWLNNAAVVRRTWEQFSQKGYGLKNVASFLGFEFNHHDACEDAITAGLIFIEACKITGYSIDKWADLIECRRIKPRQKGPSPQRITGELLNPNNEFISNINNPFCGKKVVISGTYSNWPNRKDLAVILQKLGADIDSSVSAYTNLLCAGTGVGPSKMKKMQMNIDAGKNAAIIYEDEILEMLIDCEFEMERLIEIAVKFT